MAEIKLINVDALKQMPRQPLTVEHVGAEHRDRYHKQQMDFNKNLDLQGRYCFHPFNSVTIDGQGDCYVCVCQAWLPIPVGNIMDFTSLQAIVQSPRAREIQASIIDGTYKYCDHKTCHLIDSGNLETRIDHRPDTVNWIVFALDDSCNLSCPSCRTSMIFHNKGEEFERRMAISDHLVSLIEQHDHFLKFTLSGDGDPFASHIYRNMLDKLDLSDNKNIEIEVVTNGILVKSHWNRMVGVHDNVVRMRISFDAGSPETYAVTRRGGDWNKLIESCKYIIKWKQKKYSNMEIQAAFVVQNSNYQDIHKYVSLAIAMGFDSIMLQKVTDWGKWTVGGVNYFFDHAVWQPDHANYPELVEMLNDPIMSNPRVDLTNLSHLRSADAPIGLSRTVELKNSIPDRLTKQYDQIDEIAKTIHTNASELNPGNSNFDDDYVDIARVLEQISEKVSFLRKITDNLESKYTKEISALTKEFYQQGYKINGTEALVESDYLTERTRTLPLNEETITIVESAIGRYISWEYPGLEIGPGDGVWTKHLVGCDPLYLVDTNKEFLTYSIEQFHEDYRRRVRTYTTSGTDLSMLPQNQFGFVLAWNVFNYLTADLLDLYLSEIIKVLRPGGYCMFSYNNAERAHSAWLVETGYMSYMPKTYLLKLLNKYGFEIIATQDLEEHISWVEIKKPGELTTVKAHQAMAKIVHRQ